MSARTALPVRARYSSATASPTSPPRAAIDEHEHRAAEPAAEQARTERAGRRPRARRADRAPESRPRSRRGGSRGSRGGARRPSARSPASSAAANLRTRSFSVTTCRSRRAEMSSSPSSALASRSLERARADEPAAHARAGAPLGVGGVLEAPGNTGVDDQERGLGRDADEPVLERTAVEQDRALVGSEQARGLVEDAARHADRPQLRPLAEEGELERLELEVGDRAERERERDLEGGGRREACSRREVGRDRARQTDRRPTGVGELGGHRLHVSRPSLAPRAASVGGDGLRSAVALGLERDLALRASAPRAGSRTGSRWAGRARRCSRCARR